MNRKGRRLAALVTAAVALAVVGTEDLDAKVARMMDEAKERFAGKTAPSIAIEGSAATVVDANSGVALFSKQAHRRMYPASTTKIMTALLALKYGELDETIVVGEEARPEAPDESTAGLTEGQALTLRDALSGLMLPSGNDAARVVARYIVEKTEGGPVPNWNERFAALMNAEAERLGARDTHFANPHGLHDPDHYSTASDLALIAREAMNDPAFRDIVAAKSYRSEAGDAWFGNRNKLLDEEGEFYLQGANGVKTGFTSDAGYCLVASAERDGRLLISVVLQSTETDVWTDTLRLMAHGFST
ncbi:D-alanyl-D-alanine carboxypeptidase [Paenibacillus antri]|uniref:D-alanyl-D-alanine carboxypeptidase n=1 Tax=Paenibacillus antri TaxID=2582848 RepID=A0A5R9GGC7_9BACL|nr:D-alanyl-D-alanine carboxypeptidase family protein [Paenibacillus antri]TLS53210.1 D-alanyl-D-alanine carboxypeptidase [Paenibacillus antri]